MQARITFNGNSLCNLKCTEQFACLNVIIDIENCDNTHIICDGQNACDGMEINALFSNSGNLTIDCGSESSCNDIYVDIARHTKANINCYGLYSCNDTEIIVDPDNFQNVFLNMYSFSDNIIFSNGFGYEQTDNSTNTTKQFITCNTINQFIQYPTSNSDSLTIRDLVLNEYENDKFPCDGIEMQCFNSSCSMDSNIGNTDFTINNPDQSAPCYWVSVDAVAEISCVGQCASSPTDAPTSSPTKEPTEPTEGPTDDPTMDPTADPTNDPTADPTTSAPTFSPSLAPSAAPSITPSGSPSAPPTQAPSLSPSIAPSLAPTSDPTKAPSMPPTNAPSTSPIANPTAAPSLAPSNAPTSPPTAAPTRVPTLNVDTIYDKYVAVRYQIRNLTKDDKNYTVLHTKDVLNRITEIIEMNYFNEETLPYTDFWVVLYKINGVSVINSIDSETGVTITSRRRLNEYLDNSLTLYDLDILGDSPMILTAEIQCDDTKGEVIITATRTNSFISGVEQGLHELFGNDKITFGVDMTDEELNAAEISKFEEAKTEEGPDHTAIYLSVVIGIIGVIVSFAAFVHNKHQNKKVDNAAYVVPLLVALNIYDFISDINLSIEIFNKAGKFEISDIKSLLGVLSVIFIVVPYASNLAYAMRINKQKTIRDCPSARAWFGKHLAQFILLCIVSAGTYPILRLTSSRLFGLDFFDAGLLSSDLHELSKIKIKTTVFMENVPQILIQIVYSYASGSLENVTILAFVASSLSILASVVIYKAQKDQDEEFVTAKYYIRFGNYDVNNIEAKQHALIKKHKGYRKHLGDALCKVFNISNKSIEVGYVTPNSNGCVVHIQHSIFKDDLEELKKKMFTTQSMNQGFNIQITPQLYTENVYNLHEDEINQVFLQHFGIDGHMFKATYYETYEAANNNAKFSRPNSLNRLGSISGTQKDDEGDSTKTGHLGKDHLANRLMTSMVLQEERRKSLIEDNEEMKSNMDVALEMTPLKQKETGSRKVIQTNGDFDMNELFNKVERMEKMLEQITGAKDIKNKDKDDEQAIEEATLQELDNMLNSDE